MVTTQELQALVELLSRAPMTQAEKLWAQSLIDKLAKLIETPKPVEEATGSGPLTASEKMDMALEHLANV